MAMTRRQDGVGGTTVTLPAAWVWQTALALLAFGAAYERLNAGVRTQREIRAEVKLLHEQQVLTVEEVKTVSKHLADLNGKVASSVEKIANLEVRGVEDRKDINRMDAGKGNSK